eukprot:6772568-Prymnesium_polylepis.1
MPSDAAPVAGGPRGRGETVAGRGESHGVSREGRVARGGARRNGCVCGCCSRWVARVCGCVPSWEARDWLGAAVAPWLSTRKKEYMGPHHVTKSMFCSRQMP